MKILILGAGKIADYLISKNPNWDFIAIRRTQQNYPDNVIQCPMHITADRIEEFDSFECDWLIYMPKTLSASNDSYKYAYIELAERIAKLKIKNKLFISSTRVFNGYKNIIVDENTLPKPNDSAAKLIAKFEKQITHSKNNRLLRLSGIVNNESNFIKAVLNKAKHEVIKNKFINAIHIVDVIEIIQKILNTSITSQIINGVLPSSEKYSDLSTCIENNDPVNANVQSIQYNNSYDFKYRDIKSLL